MSQLKKEQSEIRRFSPDEFNKLVASGRAQIIHQSKPSYEQLLPADLVQKEIEAWSRFFGLRAFTVSVPLPPKELFEVLNRVKARGITGFEPHYLPLIRFYNDNDYTGWKLRPGDSFWGDLSNKHIDEFSSTLDGNWILIDTTKKPDYIDHNFPEMYTHIYQNDPLKNFLGKLRREKKIQQGDVIPEGSRFYLSWDVLHTEVFPRLAEEFGFDHIRLPREIEFNILGNMHYPEWGEKTSWEHFHDQYNLDRHVIGGAVQQGGLSSRGTQLSNEPSVYTGFRPMIVFPS